VVVPDNQLSLAIGKKGQNARLAAKLTGLRIDVKSESELEEDRRRHEDERARGLAALAELGRVDAELAHTLAQHGLGSPAKIKAAGAAALMAIGVIGEEEAAAIVTAAGEWLAARQAEAAASVPEVLVEESATPGAASEPPAESGPR